MTDREGRPDEPVAAQPREEPRWEPGTACDKCGARMHGFPCIHHRDDCPYLSAAQPREEPATEAGHFCDKARAIYDGNYHMSHEEAEAAAHATERPDPQACHACEGRGWTFSGIGDDDPLSVHGRPECRCCKGSGIEAIRAATERPRTEPLDVDALERDLRLHFGELLSPREYAAIRSIVQARLNYARRLTAQGGPSE